MRKILSLILFVSLLTACHERLTDFTEDPEQEIVPQYSLVSLEKYTCEAIPGTVQFFDYYTNTIIAGSKSEFDPLKDFHLGGWNGATRVSKVFVDPYTNITTHIWNKANHIYIGSESQKVSLEKATNINSIDVVLIDELILGMVVGSNTGLHWVVATKDNSGQWVNPYVKSSVWTASVSSVATDKILIENAIGEKTNIIYFTASGNVYTTLLSTLQGGQGCVYQVYNKLEHKSTIGKPYYAVKIATNDGIAAFLTESNTSKIYDVQKLVAEPVDPTQFTTALWLLDNRDNVKRNPAPITIGKFNLVPFDILFDGDNLYATALKYNSKDASNFKSGILIYPNPDGSKIVVNDFVEIPKEFGQTFLFHKLAVDKNTAFVRGLDKVIQIDGLLDKANRTFKVVFDTNITVDIPNDFYEWQAGSGDTILSATFANASGAGREDLNLTQAQISEQQLFGEKQAQEILDVTDDFVYYLTEEKSIAVQNISDPDETTNIIPACEEEEGVVCTDAKFSWTSFDAQDGIMVISIEVENDSGVIAIGATDSDGIPAGGYLQATLIPKSLSTTSAGVQLHINDMKIVSKEESKLDSYLIIVLLSGEKDGVRLYRSAAFVYDFGLPLTLVEDSVTDEGDPYENAYSNYSVGSANIKPQFNSDIEITESYLEPGTYTYSGYFKTGIYTDNAWHYEFTLCKNVCEIEGKLRQLNSLDVGKDEQLESFLHTSAAFSMVDNSVITLSPDGTFTYAKINGLMPITTNLLKSPDESVEDSQIEDIDNLQFVQIKTTDDQYYMYLVDTSDPTDLVVDEVKDRRITQVITNGYDLFTLSPDEGIQMHNFQPKYFY